MNSIFQKSMLLGLLLLLPFITFSQSSTSVSLSTIYQKIDLLIDNNDLDNALFFYQKALKFASTSADTAFIYSEKSYLHILQENFNKSTSAYKKTIDYALKTMPHDTTFIADQYYYIAYCYYELGDYQEALHYYEKAIVNENENFNIHNAQTYSEIAQVYFRKSDYTNAILYEQYSRTIFEKEHDFEGMVRCYVGLNLYYSFKKDYAQALVFSEKAIAIYEQNQVEVLPLDLIIAYTNNALNLIKLERYIAADFFLQKVVAIHEKSQIEEEYENTLFNYAFLEFERKNWGKAKQLFTQSIAIYTEKNPKGHTNIGKGNYYLGKIAQAQQEPKKALSYFQNALQALIPDFKNTLILANPNLGNYCRSQRELMRILTAKAVLLGQNYFTQTTDNQAFRDSIFATFELAIEVVDILRQSYQTEGSRYFLAEETKELYAEAVAFCYQLYVKTGQYDYLEKAFFYAEKNQAPILLQKRLGLEGQAIGGVPDSIIQMEKKIAIDLAFFQKEQAKARLKADTARMNRFAQFWLESKQKSENLREILETNYPRYYTHQYGTKPVTLTELQHTLSPKQLYLQYYQTEEIIYLFVVTTQSANLLIINDIQTIQRIQNELLASIQNPLLGTFSEAIAYQKMTSAAYELYQRLLYDALAINATLPTRLAISANGFLAALPFEVLLKQKVTTTSNNYLILPYLVYDYAISYQPSASLMVRLHQQNNQPAPKEVLAIAPFTKTDSEEASFSRTSARSKLGYLPYTKEEIVHLEQMYKTTALYDSAAIKANFIAIVADYQIVHLATHGAADFKHPDLAYLLFHATQNEDSLSFILYNYEVQNLQLNATLAVLSACETGAGKQDVGEGILSLARSFFYTGVPSVIMSKWKINDQSSSLIINNLYQNMKNKQLKDVALQQAKKNYLQEEADLINAHPFYWAGFVQIGNTNVLCTEEIKWSWCLFLGGISLGLLFMLFRLKKHQV